MTSGHCLECAWKLRLRPLLAYNRFFHYQETVTMMKSFSAVLIAMSLLTCGCTAMHTQGGASGYSSLVPPHAPTSAVSLFSSDSDVLTDEQLQRILSYEYVPPQHMRIAILPLGENVWQGWSAEMSVTSAEMQGILVERLRESGSVHDAAYLPGILVPAERSIALFREAAARYQADLLLAYQPVCRTYNKYQLFAANQSKAYCTVEAVLLDTRTGIVPFTVTSSRSFSATKSDQDVNFTETVRNAELAAIGDALREIGDSVVAWIDVH